MSVLAELSEKVPSVAFFWVLNLILSGGASAIVRKGWGIRIAMVFTLGWFGVGCWLALGHDPLRDDVIRELGWMYPVHEIAASVLPFAAVMSISLLHARRQAQGSEIARR
jgi:hypothetical protein